MKIRVNADDFGISRGVNSAVAEMFKKQKLHSASLIYGCGYFDEALEIAKKNPDLKIGLHFNLSSGKSAFKHAQPSLLTDKNYNFRNGFLCLLFLSIFKKKQLATEVKNELAAQIAAITKAEIKLNHIDSHHHVHFIPQIFQLVVKAAKNHQIQQIRVINESLQATWLINHPKSFLWNGGILKWLVLRFLGLLNGAKKLSQSYFFSILYTCQISNDLIAKIKVPKNFSQLEIMIHPGNPKIDKRSKSFVEEKHLLSQNRFLERLF